MAWFKVDDAFHSSKPVMRIPRRHRAAAVGLWTLAGTWSSQEETDGFIPEYLLEELCGTPALAGILVRVGLWEHVTGELLETYSERNANVNGTYRDPDEPGWQFRKWSDYNPLKSELDEKREAERIRKANYRKSQARPKNVPTGHPEGHQAESNPPDPTRPDPLPKGKEREGSASAAPPKKKGHRIPEGWMPDGDLITTMASECPHVDQQMEHRKFVDYWAAQPGAKGVKLDWNATYRNWIRRASENAPRTGNRSTDRMRAGYEAMSGPTLHSATDPFAPKELTQ